MRARGTTREKTSASGLRIRSVARPTTTTITGSTTFLARIRTASAARARTSASTGTKSRTGVCSPPAKKE